MNASHKETVLITGSSNGIGSELAREFARNGHDLVIVAPVEPEVMREARRLEAEFGVRVKPIASDLRSEFFADDIFSHITASGITINILVNNAGVVRRGDFSESPLEDDLSMIHVNIEAGVRLTKRFLPGMIAAGKGRILNTASISGSTSQAAPDLAVFEATKAFVLSLSESLTAELEGTGVTLTALCPGLLDVELVPKDRLTEAGDAQDVRTMTPQAIAEIAYQAVMNGESVVGAGAAAKSAESVMVAA